MSFHLYVRCQIHLEKTNIAVDTTTAKNVQQFKLCDVTNKEIQLGVTDTLLIVCLYIDGNQDNLETFDLTFELHGLKSYTYVSACIHGGEFPAGRVTRGKAGRDLGCYMKAVA